MRHPIAKALLLTALAAPAALGSASAAQMYFTYDADVSTQANVYVDGQMVLQNVLPGSFALSPEELSAGPHEVMVKALGGETLAQTTVNVPQDGTYTLNFYTDVGTDGNKVLALGLTPGLAD